MREGIMRVRANTGEDYAAMRFRQRQGVLARSEIAASINHACNAPLEGSLNDGFSVGIETRGVDVAVAIDEQAMCPFTVFQDDCPVCQGDRKGRPYHIRAFQDSS